MYIPRDDLSNADVALTQHQELLDRSQKYPNQATPLRTQVVRVYKRSLAYMGRKMVDWGYRIHQKSGAGAEIPLLTPTYTLKKGGETPA